ncbi:MAG: COX15/CtaA family protein [Betaproteobacteria bacterium]|nr:COX15/CtaA family protein [Betaproteobacteria bacterium]
MPLRKIALLAFCLACCVAVFGAYVRLSDAGLGCPDWPGCYGQLSPLHAFAQISAAAQANPAGSVTMPKAWKEMVHRYLAAALGFLILVLAWLVWWRRSASRGLALALIGAVVLQGLLGKWTVSLLLEPAIVTGHLLGGLTTVALLAWLVLRESDAHLIEVPPFLVRFARIGLGVLALQIALGGWTSTNYAALACGDLPRCQGSWLPSMDFRAAFHVFRALDMTADDSLLSPAALTAIHWSHRLGAVLAVSVLGTLALVLSAWREARGLGVWLAGALILQVSLGLANVYFALPLPLAVAHNAGALLLLLVMVWINYALRGVQVSLPATRRGHAGAVA